MIKPKLSMKDSKGGESTTLLFVTSAFVVVTLKYLFEGQSIFTFTFSATSMAEYASAVLLVLSPYLVRENNERLKANAQTNKQP